MGARWIRLDTTWSQDDWIVELPAASRLAWVELKCYVKSHGVAGSVRKPSAAWCARNWGLSKSSVEMMFSAAFHEKELVKDGDDILVSDWAFRQSDPKAADRMRVYRKRLKEKNTDRDPLDVTPVTLGNANSPLARARDTHTHTHTHSKTSSPKSPPSRVSVQTPEEPSRPDREDVKSIEREIKRSVGAARKASSM